MMAGCITLTIEDLLSIAQDRDMWKELIDAMPSCGTIRATKVRNNIFYDCPNRMIHKSR